MAIKSAFMGFSRRFHGIFIKVAIHSGVSPSKERETVHATQT